MSEHGAELIFKIKIITVHVNINFKSILMNNIEITYETNKQTIKSYMGLT